MGKYDSDDDRRKSRRERSGRHRRSRSRSRSRGRSPRDRRRDHGRRHRSRSRSRSRSSDRRRRSRERHRETTERRVTRHRSSSKSRRGRYSNSRSRSRSRSCGRRSRSVSIDRGRRKQRDNDAKHTDSRTISSKSKGTVKDGDFEKNDSGIKNSTQYVPSADVLAKIESNSFVPETFVSQRSQKNERDETCNSHQDQSHEIAIFGVSGSESYPKGTINKPSEIPRETRVEESGIMASLLHEREESKNDRWIKKLHSMRQKKLLNS